MVSAALSVCFGATVLIDARLILVEGLMGAGKSTTAQRLWLHLRRLGREARWYHEDDTAHPLWDPRDRDAILAAEAVEPSFLDGTLLARWTRLVEGGADGVAILEGTMTMVSFLIAMGVPEEAILRHAHAAEGVVAGRRPVLIHLRDPDPDAALRKVCADRSTPAFSFEANLRDFLLATPYGRRHDVGGFAGVARFNAEVARILDRLFDARRSTKLAIDLSQGDWTSRERALTDFLGLPPMPDDPPVDRPARYLGRYRGVASGGEIEVARRDGGLLLRGPPETRLIPDGGDDFQVAGVCAALSFRDERDGLFGRIGASGNVAELDHDWIRVADR